MNNAEAKQALVDLINTEGQEMPITVDQVVQVLVGMREMHQGWVQVKIQGDRVFNMPVSLDLYDQVSPDAQNIADLTNG